MKKLWDKFFSQRHDDDGIPVVLTFLDESDSLIISLGSSILLFSILVTTGLFEIPDSIFLATAVFALYFSIAMTIQNNLLKFSVLIFTFPFSTSSVFVIQYFTEDLNRINNGLSLLALSLSLLIMPLKKFQEKASHKSEKTRVQLIRDQQKFITHLEKGRNSLEDYTSHLELLNKQLMGELERLGKINKIKIPDEK